MIDYTAIKLTQKIDEYYDRAQALIENEEICDKDKNMIMLELKCLVHLLTQEEPDVFFLALVEAGLEWLLKCELRYSKPEGQTLMVDIPPLENEQNKLLHE